MSSKIEKSCKVCGKGFISYQSAGQKYCSHECMAKGRIGDYGKCAICGNLIRAGRTKYCSMKCRNVGMKGVSRPDKRKSSSKNCERCGKEFVVGGRKGKHRCQRFCSASCAQSARRITVDHFWENNGKSNNCPAWQVVRERIVKKHDGKCAFCGRSENLQIHHVIPRNLNGGHEDKNLIPVCRQCHWAVDKIISLMALKYKKEDMKSKVIALMVLLDFSAGAHATI